MEKEKEKVSLNEKKKESGEWFGVQIKKKKEDGHKWGSCGFYGGELEFLTVVEKQRCLYDDPTLQKAIYR